MRWRRGTRTGRRPLPGRTGPPAATAVFAEPLELKAVGHIDPQTQTDMWTTASLRFEQDILAKCTCAMRMKHDNTAHIWGDAGRIEVEVPWFARGEARLRRDGGGEAEVLQADSSRHLYSYEIESFAREMRGQPIAAREIAMRFDDTLGNMKALDRWRAEIGLAYEADRVL